MPRCCESGQLQRAAGMTGLWTAQQGQHWLRQHAAVPSSGWATLSKDDASSRGYEDSPDADSANLAGEQPRPDDDGDAEQALEVLTEASPLPEMDSVQVTMHAPQYPVSAALSFVLQS